MIKHKRAFTLAEVLITLTIIGVIAAITVPVLYQNYWEHQAVSGLKKAYSTFTNAITKSISEQGPIASWDFIDESNANQQNTKFVRDILPNLSIFKDCGFTQNDICFAISKYRRMNSNKSNEDYNRYANTYKIVLNDGTSAAFRLRFPKCTKNVGSNVHLKNVCGDVYIDINGHKAPNQNGKDLFEFWVTTEGIYPKGTKAEDGNSDSRLDNSCCAKTKNGYGCSGWVITTGNMDYLKKKVQW